MQRLNFNHFFYFYVVAQEGSIKSAAEKLHVSQPTISDQIKMLEEHFQTRLFERRSRALFLTRDGEVALKYAQQIFDLAREVTSELRHQRESAKKGINIGITYYMSHYFLYDTILPLFKNNDVAVNLREGERHLLLADLEEGHLDIVFTDNYDGISASLEAHRLGENTAFAVAHKKLLKNSQKFPTCLNTIPYYGYTANTYLKYEIDMYFTRRGITPKSLGEADSVDMLQMVTEEGLAFTIVPEPAKERFCRNSNIQVIGEIEDLETSVWGIIQKNNKGMGFRFLTGKN